MCDGSGIHKDSKHIADSYYAFNGGVSWKNHITQDEVQALVDEHSSPKSGKMDEKTFT